MQAFDYKELDMKLLVGCRVENIITDEEKPGIIIELEREVEGGIIGIDVTYDPTQKEAPLLISKEYIKNVFDI